MKVKINLYFIFLLVILLPLPPASFALANSNTIQCFPKTDQRIPVTANGSFPITGLNQAQFNKILDNVERVYAPIIAAKGARLQLIKNWQGSEVNAYASRQGNIWRVEMLGGLARHREVTVEGLYAVACHEIGHHLGGAPLYSESENSWASTEGQSDYFATLKCLRKVFRTVDMSELAIDPRVGEECARSFTDETDIRICVASTLGAQSLARLMHSLAGGGAAAPNISTPDTRVVSRTFESHPAGQCRLDTGFQGALCTVNDSIEMDANNPNTGTCNRREGFSSGLRPSCWFKPAIDGGGSDDDDDSRGEGIAKAPLLNRKRTLPINNPWQAVTVRFDVSEFKDAGAVGVYIEASRPNRSFSNPNGTARDPAAPKGVSLRALRGEYTFLPGRQLPSWGVYQIRVIPISWQRTVGRFSNPASLFFQRTLRYRGRKR